MQFSELLAKAGLGQVELAGDTDVRRVALDSRRVAKGDCFVAAPGAVADGHRFIAAAVAAGACAIVCQDAANVPPGTPYALVPDARAAVGPLAQASVGWPSRKLINIAVTGTNGKTTFTYLLRHILQSQGFKVALLGTINYESPSGNAIAAPNTTPDAVSLAEMMASAVAEGGTHLVMEASSHALEQRRLGGIAFQVAAFSNLTGDHLDYHGTMDNYLAAKRKLFEGLAGNATAVLNRDDAAGDALAAATPARVLWYGLGEAADLRAEVRQSDASGSRFLASLHGRSCQASIGLIGRHNIYNCLAATAAAVALGVELDTALGSLAKVGCVPGRLQSVPVDAPFQVLVDYAHTDDALANVLSALRPVTRRKLCLVFGCGGDRDRTKRPRMAKVAEKWADSIIVTSDNPRSEEPMAIIDEVVSGFSSQGRGKVRIEPDRRRAIATAINDAGEGDVLLIAGKGHENYQIIGQTRHHFDDVETARELLLARGLGGPGRQGQGM